ncbi:hypothetical protein F751_4510 [Auxenochlorella protothecoides]|uniref:STM1-like N-terminal domain-containing protein n=1 Tax=Auxenochlorella protothecoides TaxID=3075 RepID=A0A087SND6_AUXPR|nr:hypothetical protein F751_4510 [Auxenochlorella protothecoides]KFM27240.1 hypothetical protein F751_4510 [Auxenochlorella protothecoides]
MSVATSNAFALLDDEGTVDVSALAARIPAAQKPAPKPVEETKPEPTPEEVEAAEAARREREEEERQLSLSAYEAQQAAKRASLNSAKGPTYVVDKDQFKGMKSFTKVEEDVGLDLHKNVKTIGANKGGRDKELKQKELVKDGASINVEDTAAFPSLA